MEASVMIAKVTYFMSRTIDERKMVRIFVGDKSIIPFMKQIIKVKENQITKTQMQQLWIEKNGRPL